MIPSCLAIIFWRRFACDDKDISTRHWQSHESGEIGRTTVMASISGHDWHPSREVCSQRYHRCLPPVRACNHVLAHGKAERGERMVPLWSL